MAADSQRRAQCILVKNGPLTPGINDMKNDNT